MIPAPVCAVTGGTRGIGRHVAEMLAADGWSVGLCSRSASEASATAAALSAAWGVAAIGVEADVVSAPALLEFAERVAQSLGPARAVIANAAQLGPVGALHELDMQHWAAAVAVNHVGVANTIAAFVPQMIERRVGSVIVLSGGGVGGPGVVSYLSSYTSSKAAVIVLTETVAAELQPYNVRVNAVAPGAVATGFMDPLLAAGAEVVGARLYEQVRAQQSRPPELESFDALLRFLLDDEAPLVTGRLLSARWDSPEKLRETPPSTESSLHRLRRVDDELYLESRRTV